MLSACQTAAGDDRAALAQVFWELCRDYAIVVASGGLGPTLDDVSREAAADAGRRRFLAGGTTAMGAVAVALVLIILGFGAFYFTIQAIRAFHTACAAG